MPYITEKTLAEAEEIVELLEELLSNCRVKKRDEMKERLFAISSLSKYWKMVSLNPAKRQNKAKMCEWCDCRAVRMADHQATFKCRKAREAKEFAVYDEKPVNVLVVKSVSILDKCFKKITQKNADNFVKNIKNLTDKKKQAINARVEAVMKKKREGKVLQTLTPYQIAKTLKEKRIASGRPVKKRVKSPTAEIPEPPKVIEGAEIPEPPIVEKVIEGAELKKTKKPEKREKIMGFEVEPVILAGGEFLYRYDKKPKKKNLILVD